MPAILRPYFLLVALLSSLFAAFPSFSSAARLEHSVRIERGQVTISGSRVLLDSEQALSLREPGLPALPYRVVRMLVPFGEEIDEVRFVVTQWNVIAEGFEPYEAPTLISDSGIAGGGDGLAFASADGTVFPGVAGRYTGTGYLHGHGIASFAVFPVRYIDGNLEVASEIRVELTTRPMLDDAHIVRQERYRASVDRRTRSMVEELVVNPSAAAAYPGAGVTVEKGDGGFQPTTFPSLEGSPVDYVIITNDSLAAGWQALADWKTKRGVPTVIRTTEWIEANYRNGVDVQETIRTFIIDAYQKWGITWVLLGGDTREVPARLGGTTYLGDKDVPVDMYFGCLDGDWNADHDDTFGEPGPAEDAPDLYQEVFVGRLPSRSNAETAVFVDKIISYETPRNRDYVNRVLLLAEVLFPNDWNGVDPINLDGAAMSDFLRQVAFSDPSLDVCESYENNTAYPGSKTETVSSTIDSINAGFNFTNHIGHGFRFNMSVGNGSLVNSHADALNNTDRYSNIYLLNCTAVAYTFYCLAEHFLRNPIGGAVSCLGANESAFPTVSQPYMNAYFGLVFNDGVTHIGEAFARSRLGRTFIAELGDNVDLWTHYIYSILADPEMTLWTAPLDSFLVAHIDSVGLGKGSITVVVSNSGGAVSGATVCLSKGIDDYEVKTTNGSGVASFQFTAESPGSISVVVTAPNHAMYDGTILVSQPATAYVSYTDFLVDDDSLEGTSGNADGVMDAGETVDLLVFVTNAGDVPSGNITLRFRTNTSGVTITDSLTSVGVIPAAATLPAVDPFRVQFSPSLADEETVEFVLVVESGGMEISQDRIKKLVHAPELHPVVVRVDDTTFGNGDGVIQNNEEILLFYKFKNFGTGATGGISVDIVDLDGGFVFIDSSDTYPDAVAGGLIENVAGFRMREPDTSTGHNLELTITDSYGRSYVEKFDLRGPDSPNNLTFDPSLGPDQLRVTWGASDSTDVEHYNVYRSSVPGGPYVLSNVDPVDHTVYVDRGLAATTRYYYVITAVDTSGNESGQSPEFSASTNPAQAEGWPISMPVETVSSPVIGDIDGDHDFEIVQGNDKLYAWHHDGVEIHDADLNAQTWGLFSTEGNSFVSHCALAPMDSIAGLEIIAASRDTKEVFVFNYTGATISGWPRPVENAIRAGLVAGDIDGDGQKEVIAIDELGVLYVWLSSGAEYRDGDANPATQGVFRRFGGCTFHRGSPAIADIDNDGLNEIIIGTQCDSIFVLNEDGTSVPGWPVYIGPLGTSGSIAVGDIDGDGGNDLELVVHTWDGPVTAYHHDGSVLWTKWIRNYDTFPPSPALADFDDDGQLETVVAGSDGKLYVITSAGTNRPGWPVVYSSTTTTQSSPVVADINNDGSLDIILGDETQLINGWDSDGNTLPGFPLAVSDAVRATPTVADLDKDGDVDLIVAGWDKTVYVFDFQAMFNPQKIPWASFHANLYNDGNYSTPLPTPVIDASFQFVLGQGFVDLTWYLSADAGYLFHISRATMRGTEIGDFARVASNVAVTSDGLVRYADTTVKPGTRYIYRVESVDDATRAFTTPVVYVPITAAQLMQNYPNPFNPTTTIEYFVPDGAPRPVSLVVYDVRGSRVRTLVATHQAGGHYAVDWDGLNNKSRQVSSGIYFYRLATPGFSSTKKMILLK